MPDTTNTKALYAALRDDPCDWPRWLVLADAAEEIEMAATADVFRDCGYLMREMLAGSIDDLDKLVEQYPNRFNILLAAFHERKVGTLPENVWISVQQLAAQRDEENFARRHIVGLPLWTSVGHFRDYLTPEMVRLAATVGREPGASVREFGRGSAVREFGRFDAYWLDIRMFLAARRTDGRIRFALFRTGERPDMPVRTTDEALAWADAWKEGE